MIPECLVPECKTNTTMTTVCPSSHLINGKCVDKTECELLGSGYKYDTQTGICGKVSGTKQKRSDAF